MNYLDRLEPRLRCYSRVGYLMKLQHRWTVSGAGKGAKAKAVAISQPMAKHVRRVKTNERWVMVVFSMVIVPSLFQPNTWRGSMTLAEYHNILREVIEEVNMLKQEHNICGLVMGVDAEVEFQPCHLPFTGSGLGPDKQVPPRQWGLERQFEGAFVELPGTQERYLANMNMEWDPDESLPKLDTTSGTSNNT